MQVITSNGLQKSLLQVLQDHPHGKLQSHESQ